MFVRQPQLRFPHNRPAVELYCGCLSEHPGKLSIPEHGGAFYLIIKMFETFSSLMQLEVSAAEVDKYLSKKKSHKFLFLMIFFF